MDFGALWPLSGLSRWDRSQRMDVNLDKWGNFGNPEHPAFWVIFLSANGLSLAMLLGLLL